MLEERGRLLVGSMHQRAIRWADDKGTTHELVASAQDGLLGVLGIEVDATRDQLWVASSVAPFMRDYSDDMAGAAAPSGLHGQSLLPLIDDEATAWRDCVGIEFGGVNNLAATLRTMSAWIFPILPWRWLMMPG